mgnify:CR=1 FL=1
MPNLAPPARLPTCRNIFPVLGPFLPLGFVAALFNYAACGATALPASLATVGYVQRAKHYVMYYTSFYPTQHGRSYLFFLLPSSTVEPWISPFPTPHLGFVAQYESD